MGGQSKSKLHLSATAVTGLCAVSYLGFYTAYDKATKKFKVANLQDMLTVARGWDWTLVEANKALSLTALTTTLLSFLPQLKEQSGELLFQSMSMLWIHGIYSSYKFYGNSLRKYLDEKVVRQLSLAMAAAGQVALSAGYWGYIPREALVLSGTVLGVGHFYTYEIDYKGVLQVRPFAYLPFPLALAALALNAEALLRWTKSLWS